MSELNLEQLLVGAKKVLQNATELIQEADILFQHEHFARSYSLAHLGCEELAKGMMLYNFASRHLADRKMNSARFRREFRDHVSKLRLLLFVDDIATGAPDGSEQDQEWRDLLTNPNKWNQLKNESLYVDYDADGNFIAPAEGFKKIVAESYLELAKHRLEFVKKFSGFTRKKIKKMIADPEMREQHGKNLDAIAATLAAMIKEKVASGKS